MSNETKAGGRVVRFLTKHEGAKDAVEQWFLVGIDDDRKAAASVGQAREGADEIIEVVGYIPATLAEEWGLRQDEVRLVMPGEPIAS